MDEERLAGEHAIEYISQSWIFWKKRGATCMAQGINVACTYLQDESGQPVSAQRAKTIRLFMLSCFQQLESQGLVPDSIGQASLKVLHWLIHMLCKHYIELRLCADNWKAMKLMIENYSQWYHYHVVKKQTSGRVKSEDIETVDDDNDNDNKSLLASTPAVTPPSSSPSAISAVTPPFLIFFNACCYPSLLLIFFIFYEMS
ncbi:hypothetical protein BD769DRAFT_1663990 [Suillus cothurnatus]|nr:hypothetical protein BD769DRAFT_1663990 [Suillus cothurnatus]